MNNMLYSYQGYEMCNHIPKESSNFRSAPKIVDLLNEIRPDLPQTSAIDDFEGEVVVITCEDYTGPRRADRNFKNELPPEELKSRLNKVTEKIKQETPADEELKVLMITHKVLATQQGYEKLLDILNDGLRDKEDPFLLFFMETVEPIYHALNTSDMQLLFDTLGIKRYPFKNILNDMYSRDISKKVLAGRMTRSRQGKFCGGQPPLGLMRDPEDKGHLIRGTETAPVIRKIYDMALGGWGCMRIGKQLMDDKVPITRVKSNTECDVKYYSWGSARISHILRNSFYKGAHLVCRTHQKGIRSNIYDIIPREDWEIIEDCHEAIISPEEWEQVQEIIDRRPTIMKGNSCPFYNLFHGIIYCATCGKSMQVRYEKVGRTGKNRFTGEQREPIDKAYYICQTYNRLGKNACTGHKIEARDLYNLVLKDIQELAKTALKDADAFYQRLSNRMERRYLLDASQTQKECQRLESRNREIDEMFLSLYTDKAKGILTEQRFMKLTAILEQEQEANQKRLQDLLLMMRHSDEQENEVRTFIREIRQYATIQELDETVLNRLISRILVGEVKKIDGQKVQEVRIIYNFVGEIPEITV